MQKFFFLHPLSLISFTLMAVLTLNGCGRTVWRPNSAPEIPKQSAAILTADCYIGVMDIDVEAIKKPWAGGCWGEKTRAYGGYEFHLDPGRHVIKVRYGVIGGRSKTRSQEVLIVEFQALAGHAYHINSGKTGMTWNPHVVDT